MANSEGITARHIVGGDVSYQFVNFSQNNTKVTFRVIFNMYRDRFATGVPYDPGAEFGIYQKQNDGSWAYYDMAIADPQNIDTIAYVDDPCLEERSDVGVESAFYEILVTLDIIDRDYMIAYQRCCRNTSSNNIQNDIVGTVFDIIITPEAQRTGNNSATFTEYPPIFICVNYPLSVDVSAVDAEGDELSYSFCAPFQSGGAMFTSPDPCQAIEPAVDGCLPPFQTVDFIPPFSPANPMGGNPAVSINNQTGILGGVPELVGQYVVGVCVEERRNGVLLSRIRRDFQFNVVPCEKTIAASLFADSEVSDGDVIELLKSCGDSIVEFESSGVGATATNFEWNITHPDGSVFYEEEGSQLDNFSLTFNDIGEYFGYLVVNDGSDCQDTAFFRIGRFPGVVSAFSAEVDSCFEAPIQFIDQSVAEEAQIVSWEWDVNGEFMTTDQNFTYDFPTVGEKSISLITIDDNNCSDTLTTSIMYDPPHPPKDAVVIDTTLCIGDSIFFDEKWISTAGVYGDVLQYVSTGCDSVGRALTLEYYPLPDIAPVKDTMICTGEQVTFFDVEYTESGSFLHSISSVESGCDSIIYELSLEVQEDPQISLESNVVVAGNRNYSIPITISGNYDRVEWSPAIGLSCTDCPNPILNSNTDTTYKVNVYTSADCISSAQVAVDFVVVPESYFFPTNLSSDFGAGEETNLYLQTLDEALESVTYDLQVMDRWGSLHFDGKQLPINDAASGWSSRDVLPGVYVYRFVIREYFDTLYEVGTITVIK